MLEPTRRFVQGWAMTAPALLCTDGSLLSVAAIRAGMALLAPDIPLAMVTVGGGPDPADMIGAGFDGPTLTPEEFERATEAADAEARTRIQMVLASTGLSGVESHVVHGRAGPAICELAGRLRARAIVIGSRGHGGLSRAVLGSVSDHVVRHAPCPVIVSSQHSVEADDA